MTKLVEPDRELIYSKTVIEFLTVSNEYCKFLESIEKYFKAEAFTFMQRILPLLYLKGTLLPDIDILDDTTELSPLTEEEYDKIFDLLKACFGNDEMYWDIQDQRNFVKDEGIIQLSVAEMLVDIYQDIKNFMEVYQHGNAEAKQNAIYTCKLNFEDCWGAKLLSSLKVIHSLAYHNVEVKREI